LRQIDPTGKSVIGSFIALSSPLAKNISLNLSGKSSLHLRASCPARGALAIVVNVGTGCGGRGSVGHEMESQGGSPVSDDSMRTNGAEAYSKTAWSWHPLLVSSLRKFDWLYRTCPNAFRR